MPKTFSLIIGAFVGFIFSIAGFLSHYIGVGGTFTESLFSFLAAPVLGLFALMDYLDLNMGCVGIILYFAYFMMLGGVLVIFGNWALMTATEKLADHIKQQGQDEETNESESQSEL
ncbi:hypothetical protein STSP2_00922 [Anaerohalosphaera lusitana]|uniref:Uncharacterized protein n=1 Tax=Anaerohalosphaera lusitana TaxID=1936003 RepID=A0A1U9NIL9_9BACT|nr:hypothetical protein [Anaerohalosphaera lusitana]AQT67773.1 hypothetical protein STSP2_00922 [Anaerohalosphaera lusitana]